MRQNYNTLTIGKSVEAAAAKYLQQRGIRILEKNFNCKLGEIDLIATDPANKQLIFIEVRYRKSNLFGSALDSINVTKQRKIINTAHYYLLQKFGETAIDYRFDVIAAEGKLDNLNFEWFINAFTQDN